MVKRKSVASSARALDLEGLVGVLTLTIFSIWGVWELFRGGAHRLHLLTLFAALFLSGLTVLILHFFTSHAVLSAARLAQERLRVSMVVGRSAIWDLNVKTGQEVWFGDLNTLFGIPSDSLSAPGEDFYRYLYPADRRHVSQAVTEAREKRSPYRVEFRSVHADGTVRWVSAAGEFQYTRRGDPVRMLGIALDITDRKVAERALLSSEEKFSRAFRESPVALTLTGARDHRYLDVNQTFEDATGWRRDEVIGRTPLDINIWANPAEREELAKAVLEREVLRDFEVRYRRKNGSEGVGLASMDLIEIDGEPCILSAIVDITDRKRAEDALITKKAELAEAQSLAHVGNWELSFATESDLENGYLKLRWSEELYRIHGRDPDKPLPTNLKELFTPDSWQKLNGVLIGAMETGSIPDLDLEVIRPDGTVRWVNSRGEVRRDSSGRIIAFRGTTQDITDRKCSEAALRRKEHDLVEAQRLAHIGSWEWDRETGLIQWSEELYRIHGLEPSKPAPTFEELPRVYAPESWNRIRKAMEGGSFSDMELEIIRPDKTKRWLHTRFEVTRDSHGIVRKLRGVSRDITEEKQIGDQLRESESKLAAVVNSAMDAIITVDKDHRIVLFNPAAEEMFQCSTSDAVGAHLKRFIPPLFRGGHGTHIDQPAEMGATNRGIGKLGALSALRSNGEAFPVEASISRAETDGKKLFTVIIRDVTEQFRAEQALLESEQKFRRLIEHIGDAQAVDDVQGRVVFANDQFLNLFGFQRDEIGRINLEDYAAPEYRTELRDHHDRRMRGEEEPGQYEYEGVRRDGSRVWVDANVVVIRDGEGKVVGSQKILRDVTKRKQVEHALRESEERFRLVANTAPVMIWMSGTDKLCNYFNRPWLEFTGRSIESQLGNGWAEGVHPEDLGMCLQTYTEAFDQHISFEMQYRLRRRDRQYRWVLDIGVPRSNSDGSFAGYIGSCIDITERKQAEEAMASIGRRLIEAQEEERTRIGRELHDDINQRLALLAVELDPWKEVFPFSPQLEEYVRHAQERIHEIAKDVQSLSHRLHSSKLEYLGLPMAAKSFCREFSEKNDVNVKFSQAGVPRTIPKEVSLCLFRVLQEALQNAVKYSGVREFTVDLRGTSEAVELTVVDTGSGFDEQEAFTRQGLGLISMRERLQLVHGELSVESCRGAGTTIRARVPLNREELQAIAS